MSRRLALITIVLGMTVAIGDRGLPLARAADPAQRIVRLGLVAPESPSTNAGFVRAFLERLHQLGWVEGQNLIIEQRWAEGRFDRLPALMAEVISQDVDVLVTWTTPGAAVAKSATSTVPIVALMGEPVRTGLVESLSRPGGNITGLSMGFSEGLASKWLQLLQEMVPRLSTVAVMMNPNISVHRDIAKELLAIAPKRRLKLKIIEVREAETFKSAFDQARRYAQAVLVVPDPVVNRTQITTLAAKQRLPAMYGLRDFVDAGGLMAYAPDVPAMYRRAAEYVDKILRGAKPADLPIEQPRQYQLAVNLKTAKALGLPIPESILLQADEVIR